MFKKAITFFGTAATLFVMAGMLAIAQAGDGCSAYGTNCAPSSQLIIDKFIRDPRTKGDVYVDNLSYDDYRFSPGEDIIFKVVVKNVGDQTLHNVKITDTIPDIANFIVLSGEANASMREITKDWGSVGPNETREWYFRVRVQSADQISGNTVCADPYAINRARVTADNTAFAHDAASFCVEKEVLGMTTHPATGAHLGLIAAGLLNLSGAAFAAKKFIA